MSPSLPPPPSISKVGAAARLFLEALFREAVEAVGAARVMPARITRPKAGRLTFVAAGKAAGAMTQVFLDRVDGRLAGLVVTPAGHQAPGAHFPKGVEQILAGHPVPDANSALAAERALALAASLREDDHLFVLLSGGGSALLAAPAAGLTLDDKIAVNRALLSSGAAISEMNIVRRRLSRIKGGGLARAAGAAHVTTLIISDIPGDDLPLVASGPTFASNDEADAAQRIVERYGLAVPQRVADVLAAPFMRRRPAGPPEGQRRVRLLAGARDALNAASRLAAARGFVVEDLGDRHEDVASTLGARHARLALDRLGASASRVILSGGETTVVVRNPKGRGGRNLEYLLALSIGLNGASGVFALACDTDGVDGTDQAAGAVTGPDTLVRAMALGLDPCAYLEANNAFLFFQALGDLVVTGPTRTNVNDFRAILVWPG